MKRYAKFFANDKGGCRGTITQRNVFKAADSIYLDDIFGRHPLKIRHLTPAANSYALAERETSYKR